jgi:hypothetical protein
MKTIDEDDKDRFGTAISLVTLFIGLCLMTIWLLFWPSFENCSALTGTAARYACYDKIRDELSKPPAKGGLVPRTDHTSQ